MTGQTTDTNRIVVGIDGSPGSKAALRLGARIAGGLGAQLVAVGVWDEPTTYGWSALPSVYAVHPMIEKTLNDTVDEVFGADRPMDVELRVLEGAAAPALITASRGAQMLVVGSRGLGGLAGLVLGSVSAQVARHATCPVLIVHGDDRADVAKAT
jgi:nucleotide-binding universal stress UspA family protein